MEISRSILALISFLFVVLCILLTGCSSGRGTSEVEYHDTMNNGKTKSERLDDRRIIAISLVVSGGLLPNEREWLFFNNGEISHPNGIISVTEKAALEKIFNDKELELLKKLAPEYPPEPGSADYMTYELKLDYLDTHLDIRAADSNKDTPENFLDLCDQLQQLARSSLAHK